MSANLRDYAAFQAAIAALEAVGITTKVRKSHGQIQARFAAELIKKRKIYPFEILFDEFTGDKRGCRL